MLFLLKNLLIPNRQLYTLCISIICIASLQAQNNSSAVIDSFYRLIEKADNDTTILRLYNSCINDGLITDQLQLESVYEQGTKVLNKKEDKSLLLELQRNYASKLYFAGHTKEGLAAFKNIINQDYVQEYPQFYASALLGLARGSQNSGNNGGAIDFIKESINVVRNSQYHKSLCNGYIEASILYRNSGKLESALTYIDSAIVLCINSGLTETLSSAYTTKGRIYRMMGDNEHAKDTYLQAEAITIKEKDNSQLASIWNNLGNMEHIAGNYDEAIEYYMKSIAVKEKTGNIHGMSIAYHNIGAIKLDMKDWKGAIVDFLKSQDLGIEIDFKNIIIFNDNKLGVTFYEMEDYVKSLEYHTAAFNLSEEINFVNGNMAAILGIGKAFAAMKNYKEAAQHFLDGLAIAKTIKSKPYESNFLVGLAEVYRQSKQSSITSNEFIESNGLTPSDIEDLLLRAKALGDEMNNAENKIESLQALHLFYSENKRYRDDAKVLAEYSELKDSMFTQQRTESIANWETKYETAEKEKEIVTLETEKKIEVFKKKQIRTALYGSILFFCAILFLGYNYLGQRNKRKALEAKELFRSKLSSDLHDDVGSILTGLAMQSELVSNFADGNVKKSVDKIALMSRDAMSRMRDTVWAIDSRKDSYADLIDRMLDFGEDVLVPKNIQLKFNKDIKELDQQILPEVRQNIYLIFKEAISNIAKYSTADIVEVSLSTINNTLHLLIHDNGNVASEDVKSSGTGTSNILARAKDLGGQANIKYGAFGYHVDVKIPVSKF